jgi:hypothetical protein
MPGSNDHDHRRLLMILGALLTVAALLVGLTELLFGKGDTSKTEVSLWGFKLATTSTAIGLASMGIIALFVINRRYKNRIQLPPETPTSPTTRNSPTHPQRDAPNAIPTHNAQQKVLEVPAKEPLSEFKYIVLRRTVTTRYATRTKCTMRHEIEIECTRDYMTHYEGRHRIRAKQSSLSVLSPHSSLTFGETDAGFQKFYVQFLSPINAGDKETIISELTWEDELQLLTPESSTALFAPTEKLRFVVFPPPGTSIVDANGFIRQHPGEHTHIKREPLTSNDEYLLWEPKEIEMRIHYRVTWKWK